MVGSTLHDFVNINFVLVLIVKLENHILRCPFDGVFVKVLGRIYVLIHSPAADILVLITAWNPTKMDCRLDFVWILPATFIQS